MLQACAACLAFNASCWQPQCQLHAVNAVLESRQHTLWLFRMAELCVEHYDAHGRPHSAEARGLMSIWKMFPGQLRPALAKQCCLLKQIWSKPIISAHAASG